MTEDEWELHWARLRAHLGEVQPIFDAFCFANGFVDMSVGRYPRICIQRQDGQLLRSFQLDMGLDADGKRFEQFSPEVPYDLYCVVTMYVTDELSNQCRRYTSAVVGFADKPFREVPALLRDVLDKHLVILDQVTAEYLLAYGHAMEMR